MKDMKTFCEIIPHIVLKWTANNPTPSFSMAEMDNKIQVPNKPDNPWHLQIFLVKGGKKHFHPIRFLFYMNKYLKNTPK